MGRTLADVKGIILTTATRPHGCRAPAPDHGVPVYVHVADAARAKGGPVPKTASPPFGSAPPSASSATPCERAAPHHPLTEVVEVHDGDTLDLPGSPRIIGMPGHSEGSIAIHVPLVDAVFVGDALTTRHVTTGALGPAPAPFTDEPERAIESLKLLLPTKATWVLPGHGPAFGGGVDAAVAAVQTVH